MPARVTLGLAGAVGLLGVVHFGGLVAFGRGWWVPLVPATLGWVLATGSGFAYQYVVEGREKRQVRGRTALARPYSAGNGSVRDATRSGQNGV